jgi:hypothetical protein
MRILVGPCIKDIPLKTLKKKCSCMVQPNKWTIAPLLLRLHVRVDNGQGRSGPGPKTPFDPIHGGGEVKSISNRFFSFVQTDLSPMKSWVCGTIFFFFVSSFSMWCQIFSNRR